MKLQSFKELPIEICLARQVSGLGISERRPYSSWILLEKSLLGTEPAFSLAGWKRNCISVKAGLVKVVVESITGRQCVLLVRHGVLLVRHGTRNQKTLGSMSSFSPNPIFYPKQVSHLSLSCSSMLFFICRIDVDTSGQEFELLVWAASRAMDGPWIWLEHLNMSNINNNK